MLVITVVVFKAALNLHGPRAVRAVLLVPLCLVAVLNGLKYARLGVTVIDGADEFEVRNPIRRYTVKWAEVEHFASGPGFYGAPLVEIYLKTGKRIKCYALAGRYPKRWGTTPWFVEEFNRMLAERRGPSPGDRS
jgi:hypothetical protein